MAHREISEGFLRLLEAEDVDARAQDINMLRLLLIDTIPSSFHQQYH